MLASTLCLSALATFPAEIIGGKIRPIWNVGQHYWFILLKTSILLTIFNISKCMSGNWALSAIAAPIDKNINFLSVWGRTWLFHAYQQEIISGFMTFHELKKNITNETHFNRLHIHKYWVYLEDILEEDLVHEKGGNHWPSPSEPPALSSDLGDHS